MGATVAPETVLKQLAELWVSTGKEEQGEDGTGVLRACTMTLVVLAEESDDAQSLGETLAALMPEHPARAIVIRLRGAGERALTERVYSQCWMPFGQRRQICCEQVELTASDAALGDLPSVVLPLAVPDLPLILWCRSARLAGMAEFWPLAAMAHKVIVDSAAMGDSLPRTALERVAETNRRGILVGDLSWTRLTRWREMLAQVFENQENLARLAKISSVELECGSRFYVSALYLGIWVNNCLADAGGRTAARRGEGRITLDESGVSLRVRLAGEGLTVELARQGDRMIATVNGVSQCTNLPPPSEYLLMREELGIVRRDPVFEKTLASAARPAYPTGK
ncbi:MAG TPA: glucose-6-phosphate dehydrogenase assembly protein OpcA [Bryobacteraceae bacterium]|nr:glucose-6-phosphate dehydrogenase assembly protein OpcA [Bryobacteraceae bacterium]